MVVRRNGDIRRVRVDADNESDAVLAAKQVYRRQHYGKAGIQPIVSMRAIRTEEDTYGN